MRLKRGAVLLLVVVFLFGVVSSGMGAAPLQGSEKVDILIGFHGTPNRGLVEAFGGEVYREFTIVDVIAARMPQRAADALGRKPGVRYVELDAPVYALEMAVMTEEQTVPWGIDRVFGDEEYSFGTWENTKGDNIAVAVIDTGIDVNHEDLKVAGGVRFRTTGPFLRQDDKYDDDHGHGTHVAGTIAALDNDLGVVGVGPKIDLYAVKVLDASGSGSISSIVAGIEWAMEEEIPILNMSLGSSSDSTTLRETCEIADNAGHLLVAAAGNSGNKEGTGDNVLYPANYESVIAVAASTINDDRASFSSTGSAVELIAPGAGILSTWKDNGYREANGTSMASPHVAGVAALVWAADHDLTNVQIREVLQETAEDLVLSSNRQGYGLVRGDLAVRAVAEVELPATGDIEGTVKDGDDAAIVEATVVVEGTNLSATTDANGDYLLENVPAGDQQVTASADGYYSETEMVTVVEDDTVTQNFVLDAIPPAPTYTVSGIVTDTDEGYALEGATVAIEETGQTAITDSEGTYSISDIEEGTYDITASKEGYASQTKTVTVDSNTTLNFALEEVTAADEVSVESITYSTRGGRFSDRHLDISLFLLDDEDNPVADASVSATLHRDDGSSWNFQGTTGSDGTVTFSLNNHGSGCYWTEVNAVEAEGLEWDEVTPENGYCK